MKYIINDEVVLSRAPEGPLIVWLDRFASFASSKGYVRASIHRQVLLAAGFSQWQAGHCQHRLRHTMAMDLLQAGVDRSADRTMARA